MIVKLDIRQLEQISNLISENKQKRIINGFINSTLFAIRKYSISGYGLPKELKIRSKGLVKSHIRIEKSTVGFLCGYWGSIGDDRFSGWEEQEHGNSTKRNIVIHTKNARGSSGKRTLQKKYRRDADAVQLLQNQKNTTSDIAKITATLSILRRKKYNGVVELSTDYYDREAGRYQMSVSGKVASRKTRIKRRKKRIAAGLPVGERLYDTKIKLKIMEIFKRKQPKRVPWGENIINRFMRIHNSQVVPLLNAEIERVYGKWKK